MRQQITRAALRAILALSLMLATMVIGALDFPHTPSSPIIPDLSCLNCHDLNSEEAKLLRPSQPHPEMDGDDTNPNNLCWSCHTGPQLASYRAAHSSQQVGGQFGEWFIECRTCHNPHYQPQFIRYGERPLTSPLVSSAVWPRER
ncbi:MAG: hypothetical protein L3J26_11305 [Candidatus Polarisedimenticolaceae bacterium]|nr:hypothetical protein [Candidatus Polarisedimenticolaceae bacterium]